MDLSNVKPSQGISALQSVFTEFLKLAKYLDLKPLYPEFILSGHHNSGKSTSFLKYIDLPDYIHIESECDSTKENTFIWIVEHEWMLYDEFYKNYKEDIRSITIKPSFSLKKEFELLGKKIIETFERPICCIHVRRTDYLRCRPSTNKTTTAEAILSKIDSLATPIATIYNDR